MLSWTSTPASRRLASARALVLAAGFAPLLAAQGIDTPPRTWQLPAQPLEASLQQLARQAGLRLSAPEALVAGKHAPALSGVFAVKPALDLLLAGSGLVAELEGATLRVLPAPQEGAAAETVLPGVQVSASAPGGSGLPKAHPGGQVAKGARLGILGNLSLMDTPFNLTSYTAALIQDQQARSVADVLLNDPSVRFTTSSGHMYENFRVRGFDVNASELAIDGLFGVAPVGHSPVEFAERVELLKGPSALFSGMAPGGGIGGVINLVPKRATNDPVTQVSLGYQSGSQASGALDLGRRFGESRRWGLRVNGAYSDGGTELEGQSRKREFVSAALDYRGEALKASVDAYHSLESFRGGTPAMFWFATPSIPEAPDPRINQFPNGFGELESNAVIARADYALNAHLSAFAGAGLRKHDFSGFINGTHARQIDPAGNYTGRMVAQLGSSDNESSEAGLRARFTTAAVRHEVVLHATRLEVEDASGSSMSSFSSNIYRPVTAPMIALPGSAPKTGESVLSSWALVDAMSFLGDAVRLTLGLRDQGVTTLNYGATGAVTARYDKRAATPSAALVVKPFGPSFSLYANCVQGLSKGDTVTDTAATNYREVFAPYKTEQKEVGAKWNAGTFTHTVSLFEITKPVLVTLGSAARPTYSDSGEKRVRGVEWNAFGELAPNLRLLGGATYSQGIQTRTAYDLNNGKEAVGAPRWQGNLGAEWDLPWLRGFTLNGRVFATTRQFLDAANTQEIPGWGQVDFGLRHATTLGGRAMVLRLNVVNLFDRRYYSGSFSDSTPIATLGPARSVSASMTLNF